MKYRNSNFKSWIEARSRTGTLFVCFLLLPFLSEAQYFAVGQDPGSIRWRQIQTTHFQLIYPSDYEPEAQRAAHIFEKVYDYSGVTLRHQPKKISILLHTKSNESNGFVAWSPSRIELFPTPHQGIYAQDWMEQLAIHELRHHVQIDKIESELPAIFKILLGEQAASIVIGAYLPFWYLEGDAVVSETALSHSGRGRISSFSMELKAQADEKGIYSFDKAYLGSYKDYIPDYYQLGYQMVSNIRNQNGGEVWSKVLHHIARNPLGINSLSKGLRLATGKNQDEFYNSIMFNLKQTNPFGLGIPVDTSLQGHHVIEDSNDFTDYSYPYFVDDSTYVAYKTSLKQIPEIVLINRNQNEQRLLRPGQIHNESMSVSDHKIVWIESKPDLRWTYRNQSLLRILDIENGLLREKIFSEKLYAPVLSPNGKWIAAVKYDDKNRCSIIVFNEDDFELVNEYSAKGYNNFITPAWSEENDAIYAVELAEKGKSIIRINLPNGAIEHLTAPIYGELKKPVQSGKFLLYCANLAGKMEGYAMELKTGNSYRIASGKYGIKDLQSSPDGSLLLFADYSANGFKIALKEFYKYPGPVRAMKLNFQDTLSENLATQEKGVIDFSGLDSSQFNSHKYAKFKNLINIHSWSPIYIDPDQSVVNAGFSIISQNKLSTAITQIGYDYSTANHTGKWIGKFEYAGWYPVLRLYGDYGKEKSTFYQINKHFSMANGLASLDTVAVPYTQTIMNLHIDAAIPFNFSHGKMYRLVEPEIQVGHSYKWQDTTTPSSIFRGSYIPFTYRLYAHNILKLSPADIQSRWGQVLDLHYRHTPLGDRHLGTISAAEGTLFLPGMFKNQGTKIYMGYQQKNSDNNYFSDLVYYPRGYTNVENNSLMTFRSDYVLPLWSPDWNIWRLYYLKRITLRVHYDFSLIHSPVQGSESHIERRVSSTGGELLTECHFLRFIAPVKIGARESLLIESKKLTTEFILSINFNGM